MLFNSLHFVIFFPLFLCAYFLVPRKDQYKVMVLGGYYFYGSFNWYLLLILFGITCNDFFAGKMIEKTTEPHKRKRWLMLSIAGNLGVLIACKYLNFIDDNLREIFAFFHINWPIAEVAMNDWIVPVGFSFITFQSLSYTIDVYKGLIRAEKSFGHFCAFTAFWPVMVNGPIERGKNLLPQINCEHAFDVFRLKEGLLRMAWGMFKKVVIADRLAFYVDDFYTHYQVVSGWTIWIGGFLFVLQVYCDFSGYSDIAIGCARILGIDVMENFKRPLYSKNMSDFWTRWHISLSTWLTDYVFYYLGAYKAGSLKVVFNVIFVLTLCGLWHGANWPMILAFTLIGIFMAIRFLWQQYIVHQIKPSNLYKISDKYIPSFMHVILTISIFIFCFILFRVNSFEVSYNKLHAEAPLSWMEIAKPLYQHMFNLTSATYLLPWLNFKGAVTLGILIFYILILLASEYVIGDRKIEEVVLPKSNLIRWSVYLFLLFSIVWFGVFNNTTFVYFQY